jgi:hypothetical protein
MLPMSAHLTLAVSNAALRRRPGADASEALANWRPAEDSANPVLQLPEKQFSCFGASSVHLALGRKLMTGGLHPMV